MDLEPEPSAFASFKASIAALITKEARWRMRGRRAFVIVTIYLALLALLVVTAYQFLVDRAMFQSTFNGGFERTDFVPGSVSATVGQAVFGNSRLQTVLTILLAQQDQPTK